MPEAHEMIYHSAFGYSYSQSPFDRIIYIALAESQIVFGFFFGRNLADPQHLLEGTGKRMRHVKINSIEDTSNPALETLIRDAWKDTATSIPKLHTRTKK